MQSRKIITILGVALILLILIRTYRRKTIEYVGEGFSDASGPELIIAKAAWCGHCQNAAPEFEKLKPEFPYKMKDGSSCTLRILEHTDPNEKPQIDALGIQGFPTILYRSGGNQLPYEGDRTYSGIMGFINGL